MFQEITIIGNLGKDPVSKVGASGKSYSTFSVGVNRKDANGQKETAWFYVSTFEKTGQYVMNYAKSGSLVMVKGRLQFDAQNGGPRIWTDASGSPRASFEIIADKVQILAGYKNSDDDQAAAPTARQAQRYQDHPEYY